MSWLLYQIRRAWLRRSIAVCRYRLAELDRIVERERICIEYQEEQLNRRLRELETRSHFDKLARGMR